MEFKIVFLDIDGTLLNPEHQITEGTQRMVRKVNQELGIPVVLATARPYKGAYFFRDQLGLKTPIICFNGALIVEKTGEFLADFQIAHDQVRTVNEYVEKHSVNLAFLDANGTAALKRDKWVMLEENLTEVNARIGSLDEILGDWGEEKGPNKLMAMGEPESIQILQRDLKSLEELDLTINISHPSYLEITHPKAAKHKAIQLVHEKLGIKKEQVIAVGDSFNDLEMIKYAGCGVAMGNAHKDVQSIADIVTLPNTEDGVKKVLSRFFI